MSKATGKHQRNVAHSYVPNKNPRPDFKSVLHGQSRTHPPLWKLINISGSNKICAQIFDGSLKKSNGTYDA